MLPVAQSEPKCIVKSPLIRVVGVDLGHMEFEELISCDRYCQVWHCLDACSFIALSARKHLGLRLDQLDSLRLLLLYGHDFVFQRVLLLHGKKLILCVFQLLK